MMAFWGAALFLLLISPVRLGAALSWAGGGFRLAAGILVWGVRVRGRLDGARGEGDRLRLEAAVQGRPVALPQGKRGGAGALGRMLKRGGLRFPWGHAARLYALEGTVFLGGDDAAALALAAGALRALLARYPKVKCFPSFGGECRGEIRCIAESRLGMLLAAGLVLAYRSRREIKEEKHGSSHRAPDANDPGKH